MENKPIFVNLAQGSPKWHEHRAKFKNASEAPIIMGESSYLTRRQLAEIKLGLISPQLPNQAMMHGKRYEPKARKHYIKKHGKNFSPYVVTRDLFSASLDGLSDDGKEALEIKCPVHGCESKKWELVSLGFMPDEDFWQVQHQIYTSFCDVCNYSIYCWKHNHEVKLEQTADGEKIEKLVSEWKKFWSIIENGELPAPGDKDIIERSDEDWAKYSHKYLEAKNKIDSLSKEMEKARKGLIKLAGGFSFHGCGITLKAYKKGKAYSYKIYKDE